MQVLNENQKLTIPSIATIGVFDGIHNGHQFLLNNLNLLAKQKSLATLVVTFSNLPENRFHPNYTTTQLTTTKEKLLRVEKQEIENCLLLDFTEKIACLSAKEFMLWLKNNYSVKALLMGYDHNFGKDKISTFDQYKQIGAEFDIECIKCTQFIDKTLTVSSSNIRKAILLGDLETANQLLGYNYTLTGIVIKGNQIGRTIGFPTANIGYDTAKLIPQNGVYIANTTIDGKEHRGLLNIGTRPTIGGKEKSIELHILNFDGNLYGKEVIIEIIKKIRNEVKFSTLEQLKEQITKDKELLLSQTIET